jgi:aspartyl/asparaginyl-tRNA synthetase
LCISGPVIDSYSIVDTLTKGTSVKVVGELVPSPAAGQPTELRAGHLEVLGPCDGQSPSIFSVEIGREGKREEREEGRFGLLLPSYFPWLSEI